MIRVAINGAGRIGRAFGSRMLLQSLMFLLATLTVIAVASPASTAIGMDPLAFMLLTMMLLFALSTFELIAAAGQAVQCFSAFASPSLLPRAALIMSVVLMSVGVPPIALALLAALTVGYLLSGAAALWALPRGALIPSSVDKKTLKAFFEIGWAMPIVTVCAFLVAAMDVWLLRALAGMNEAGTYGWAYNVNLLVMNLLAPISALLAPVAVDRTRSRSPAAVAGFVHVGEGAVALAAAAMPAGAALAGIVLGELPLRDYTPAIAPALVLAAGAVFQLGMACLEPLVLIDARLVPRAALIAASMATINFALDVWLIPVIGIMGPALATVASFAFGMLAYRRIVAAGYELKSGAPWFALTAGILAVGMAALWQAMPPSFAVTVGIGLSLLLLFVGRRMGAFDALRELSLPPHLALLTDRLGSPRQNKVEKDN